MTAAKVLIAGGGIGGLALAVGLRERGIDAEVFERARSYGNVGSGIELTPNGVKSVDKISPDLGRAIRATGWSSDLHAEPVPIMSWDGKLLKRRDLAGFSQKWAAPAVGILRSELHRLLYEALSRPGPGSVTIHHMARVAGGEPARDGVTVRLADGRAVTGDVLVGADGVRSVVRTLVSPDAHARYLGFTSVRGISKRPAVHSDGFILVGPKGHFWCEAVNQEQMCWTATVHCPEGTWPAKPAGAARTDLLNLWGGWTPPMPEIVESCDLGDLIVTDVHDCSPLRHMYSGRVVLLGDAAHPIGPVLGQGANMAMEDAACLSGLLASGGDVPSMLRGYDRARLKRTNMIVHDSRVVARLTHTTNPAVGWLRDFLVKRVRRDETYRDSELFGYNP
jgi:salicylate hydroxylase